VLEVRIALAAFVLAFASPAIAQDTNACVSAYERGQVDRRAGHFDGAREAFATCTAEGCPSVVKERCVQFARDLEAAQPTLIVVVHDETGHDVGAVRVALDGAAASPLPSTALRVDPGEHTLRVETGLGNAEQRLVVREGEKNRRVELAVGRAIIARMEPTPSSTTPIAAWTFTGIGALGVVTAGVLSAVGWGMYGNLSSQCGHQCSDDRVAPLRTVWTAAFIPLGIGLIAGGVAVALFVSHGKRSDTALVVTPGFVAGTF
jgi:hypothetical protein